MIIFRLLFLMVLMASTAGAQLDMKSLLPRRSFIQYYSNVVMADSPVGYWRLDESAGTTMTDYSGNGYNGVYSNTPSLNVSGVISNNAAVSFNYSSLEQGAVADNAALSITGQLTLECWLMSSGPFRTEASNRGLVAKYRGASDRGYALFMSTNIVGFSISPVGGSGSVITVMAPTGLESNTWYHVVATYIPSTSMTIYTNGVLCTNLTTSIPSSIFNNAAPLDIGTLFDPSTSGQFWSGRIDEAAVYNTALSAGRIAAHYNASRD